MTKTDQQRNSSGYQPFTYTMEQWDEKAQRTVVKLDSNKIKFDDKMIVLQGNETPELLLLWKKDYDDKIMSNKDLNWDQRIDVLGRIVTKEAQIAIRVAMDIFKNEAWKSIKNLTIHNKVKGMTKADQLAYWKSEDSKEDLIHECMHHLKLKIFGSDYLGQSAYIQLRRIIRTFRVRLDPGIRAYDTRVTALNSYLLECPWQAGAKRKQLPKSFDEFEKREILETAITKAQAVKLNDIDWDIQENTYDETISKLESLESGLKREVEMQRQVDIISKANGGTPSRSNRSNASSSPVTLKRIFPDCDTCGKKHKGECWKKNGGGPKSYKKARFDNDTKNYIKQMVEKTIKTGGNVSDDDTTASWKKGLNQTEQMYVLCRAGFEAGDSDIDIEPEELKEYKKAAKKASKNLKRK